MINYSILIPFRDKYDLLQKAILSIPDREDIQVILIYNGDGSFPAGIVPDRRNVKIDCLTSSSAKGAGHARNKGLDVAEGRFLLFLDSDDYFTDSAFEAFDKYLDTDSDIIFFKPTSIYLKNGDQSSRHIDYSKMLDKYLDDGCEDRLRYRWEPPWSKMFRKELILDNGIKFQEIKVNNDAWFSIFCGHNAKKITADSSIVYVITEGENGQSLVKVVTPETVFLRFKEAIKINKFLRSINKGKLRIRLLGGINIALKNFGPVEAFRLLKYAIHEKANIF